MPHLLGGSKLNAIRCSIAVVVMAAMPTVVTILAPSAAEAAGPPTTDTMSYSVGTPQLTSITNGTSAAPWNIDQGDTAATSYSNGTTRATNSNLFPTFQAGGPTTTTSVSGETGSPYTEPNVAVYGGANSGTANGYVPYPSGVVGTPGPLDDYCGSGSSSAETGSTATPSRQPDNTVLPMSPYYFPHIVSNSDGSLTGYFDWRPKDADEATVVARSTDGGADWTYEGEALEQDPGYCAVADNNDDGEGHPDVLTFGSNSYLYTLQRSAGDEPGVGLLVHSVNPSATNPLSSVPATEKVGVDPDAFSTGSVALSHGTAATVNVNATDSSYLDSSNNIPTSPAELVPGPFVDITQNSHPTASNIITCTGVTATSLTGCTLPSGSTLTVASGDLIEQVLATVSTTATVPAGPNQTNVGTSGTGGLATLSLTADDALPLTIFNNLAPGRAYVGGYAIYCDQSNASPTTKLENCTTGGQGATSLSATAGLPVTEDPVVPATATMTNGLVAPDGIVGILPSYPGTPTGSTAVMYTEKINGYFLAGVGSGSSAAFSSSFSFFPSNTESADLPSTITAANPATFEIGDSTKGSIIPMTCTGLTVNSGGTPATVGTDTLTGCTVPSGDTGDSYAKNAYLGTAGANTTTMATLAQIGEGSTSVAKLFKNNEDLEVLRVAYTTDGINFSSAGLANNGIISGASNNDSANFNPSTPASDNFSGSNYTDLTNPLQTTSPSNLNQYGASGSVDASEMRWIGSTGTIIQNADGSIGLFLNGAFAADGDSDAFNQIFYSQSSNGENWTTPVSVLSTDYTFAASTAYDTALASGGSPRLGISAYYSGRAYNPTIVQNSNGTLTMLFSGYRIPGSASVGSTGIGTNAASTYSPGATDPLLYRTILMTTLTPSTSQYSTATAISASPTQPTVGQSVTYTATVTSPGGLPSGSVSFSDGSGSLCSNVALPETSPDTATCTTTYHGSAVTAAYSGDTSHSASNGSISFLPTAPTGVSATGGDRSATISWSAPTSSGGSPITSYTASDGSGDSCTTPNGSTTSCTVTGLTNGTQYSFTVVATNANGNSPASSPATATPLAVPGAPTGLTAQPSNGQASFSWTAPSSNGGSPISSYTVSDGSGDSCTTPDGNTTSCSVTGLTNGTAYSFTVTAANAVGSSAPSNAVAVTPGTVPGAPTGATAQGGNHTATISWTAPTSNGGSPITSYTASDGSGDSCTTADGSTTSCTVTGLTNGTSYTFSVVATNSFGNSAASNPVSVTPLTVPDPPTNPSAQTGNHSVTISWTAPGSNGGSPITSYTASDGSGDSCTTADGSTTSCTVTGLTNGTSYTFTVVATNAAGSSSPSTPVSATPGTVPGAPTNVTATPGDRTATVSWNPPSSNGGGAITAYTVSDGSGDTCSTGGGGMSCTVTGLTNGTTYSFTVTATNANGTSTPSSPVSVTPGAVPGAPTGVSASPGNQSATISWTAPASDGGSPITSYTASDSSGDSCTTSSGSGTSCTVTGLTNGTQYSFTVVATNSFGNSPASAAATVTPATVPGAPTGVSATPGNQSATISWTAPASDGGSPITSYTASDGSGDSCTTPTGSSTSCTVTGLTNGTSYTFTVVATNSVGNSPASSPVATTPQTVPGAPTGVSAQAGYKSVTVSWSPPNSDGGSAITQYSVSDGSGGSCTTNGAGSSCTVTGLSNGTAYTFTVTATNPDGTGPASTPVTATPTKKTFLFVDENPNGTNEVRNYVVNSDGSTTLVGSYSTGHPGLSASWLVAGRSDVASTSDHLYAMNLGDQTVTVFSVDPATGALTAIQTTPSLNATAIAVNPADSVLYAGGSANEGSADQLAAYTINPNGTINPTPVSTVPADLDGLAISPDGSEVVTAYPGTDKTYQPQVQLFGSDANGDLTAESSVPTACPTDARFGAASNVVYTAACYQGSIDDFNIASGSLTETGSTPASAEPSSSQTLAVGPDGTVYFDTSAGLQGATVSGPPSGPTTFTLGAATSYPTNQSISSLSVTPDGKALFVAAFDTATISEFSIGTSHSLTKQADISVPAGLPTIEAYSPS